MLWSSGRRAGRLTEIIEMVRKLPPEAIIEIWSADGRRQLTAQECLQEGRRLMKPTDENDAGANTSIPQFTPTPH